ncbi:DUF498-domain-containing protein [Cystobasidium minutum MCA 4210]|uniref:DUF498-domain-containing protein n=1 Tax=Cystobasidium minutum MCA 4210 TaxID=1397322 RepID=UPI0034CD5E9E|eukprot:jgi/Rhomi1/56379/CE56378_1633
MASRRAVQPLMRSMRSSASQSSSLSRGAISSSRTTCQAARSRWQPCSSQRKLAFSTASARQSVYDDFRNIFDDAERPPVMVDSCSETSFKLTDGIILPCNAIFHNGTALMWDTPPASFDWKDWNKEMFEIFEFTSPKPDILLFGTGRHTLPPPAFLRPYLNSLGIQLDVMDSRNACSTFNLLAEEGRRVAAAVLTLTPMESRTGSPIEGLKA